MFEYTVTTKEDETLHGVVSANDIQDALDELLDYYNIKSVELRDLETSIIILEESTLYNYTLTTANGTKYENTISGTSLFKISEILKDTFPSAKEIEFKKDGETITTFYYD